MAHRGKYYPVNFRRDFNHNANIASTSALPECWRNDIRDFDPPQAPAGHTFIACPDPALPGMPVLGWISDWATVAGHEWRVRLQCDFPSLPDTLLRGRLFMDRRDVGLVAIWKRGDPDYFDAFNFNIFTQALLYWDPAVFTRAPQFQSSILSAVGY